MTKKLMKPHIGKGYLFVICLLAFAPLLKAEAPGVTVQTHDGQYRATLEIILKRAAHFIREEDSPASNLGFRSRRNILGGLAQTHRTIVLKNFKESLALTVEGGRALLDQKNLREAKNRLEAAQKKYSDNPISWLLLGDLYDLEGEKGEAMHYYLGFWEHVSSKDRLGLVSLLFSESDKILVSKHVQDKLRSYGFQPPQNRRISDFSFFPKPKSNRLTFSTLLVAYLLPLLVVMGIPFLLLRRLLIEDTSRRIDRIFYQAYFVLIGAYLIWLAHLFFNVPPVFKPAEWEVLAFIAAGGIFIAIAEHLRDFFGYRKEASESGTAFCPHCKKVTLKIVSICPFCNREINRPKGGKR